MKRRLMSILVIMVLLISSIGVINVNAATSGVYEYEMYTDKTVKITKYTGGAASELTIPEKIKGYPVAAIGEEAFMNAELYSIALPSTLEYIADFAFWNTAISKITIPKNVSHIGIGAFSGGLFEAYVTEYGSEHYRAMNGVLYTADMKKLVSFPTVKGSSYDVGKNSVETIGAYSFMYTMELNSVTLSDGVKTIEEGAFLNSSVSSINLGEGMETVAPYAFANCTKLKIINIPKSVERVGNYMFYECTSLEDITIPEGFVLLYSYDFIYTAWFEAQPDGLLYLCNNLIGYKGDYEQLTTVAVAEGTLAISDLAFFGYDKITSVTIPDSVKYIGNWAFEDCPMLTEIEIPSGVEEIGMNSLGYIYEYNEETEEGRDVPLENFTIKGDTNSEAEIYAVTNGFNFVSTGEIEVTLFKGDTDLDGFITIKDATAIQKYLASLELFVSQQKKNADMNGDGEINIKDATAIQKHIAGLEY